MLITFWLIHDPCNLVQIDKTESLFRNSYKWIFTIINNFHLLLITEYKCIYYFHWFLVEVEIGKGQFQCHHYFSNRLPGSSHLTCNQFLPIRRSCQVVRKIVSVHSLLQCRFSHFHWFQKMKHLYKLYFFKDVQVPFDVLLLKNVHWK